jgi:hypothetical protein
MTIKIVIRKEKGDTYHCCYSHLSRPTLGLEVEMDNPEPRPLSRLANPPICPSWVA